MVFCGEFHGNRKQILHKLLDIFLIVNFRQFWTLQGQHKSMQAIVQAALVFQGFAVWPRF